jgi:hypothetical protein
MEIIIIAILSVLYRYGYGTSTVDLPVPVRSDVFAVGQKSDVSREILRWTPHQLLMYGLN